MPVFLRPRESAGEPDSVDGQVPLVQEQGSLTKRGMVVRFIQQSKSFMDMSPDKVKWQRISRLEPGFGHADDIILCGDRGRGKRYRL